MWRRCCSSSTDRRKASAVKLIGLSCKSETVLIFYVNGENRDKKTALGKLMHDFFCTEASDMNYAELAEQVRYYKESEKGVNTMSKVLEDMKNEAAKNAVWREKVEMVRLMCAEGDSIDKIARVARLTVEQVREIVGAQSA